MKVTKQRRQREREARRRSILQAAFRLFVQKGYEHTTIEQIAEEAELSKGLVYFYFDSKDQILATLIQEAYAELHRLLQARLSPLSDPVEKLCTFIETEVAFYARRRDLFRLLTSLLGGYTLQEVRQTYQEVFLKAHERERQILREILEENVKAGTLRIPRPDLISVFIGGALHGFLTLLSPGGDFPSDWETFRSLLFHGILKKEEKK